MGMPEVSSEYFWVRVYDYEYERDQHDKGTLLDEFYLSNVTDGRDSAKLAIRLKYNLDTDDEIRFAKPRNNCDGIYAILMESTKYYHDRFYATLTTHCFWCHNSINGKACEFPSDYIGEDKYNNFDYDRFSVNDKVAHFCNYECKRSYSTSLHPTSEGEWQNKQGDSNGNAFGYIYLMYNRVTNCYYIGQTRFMPFFRWQEHIKGGEKGSIEDLTFSVLATVNRNKISSSDNESQQYLNSIEGWWIAKYREEGFNIINISNPRITIVDLKRKFEAMILSTNIDNYKEDEGEGQK